MTIYIYVKTHNETGLKYLGKTKSKDPHKYPGSGVYWTRHLDVHGRNYSTEIIKECQTKEEVKYWGLYYSNLWNVVNDPNWANIKKENGDGGGSPWSDSTREKMKKRKGRTGMVNTLETRAKQSESAKKRRASEETKAKMSASRKGRKLSEEHKAKIGAALKGKPVTEERRARMKELRAIQLASPEIMKRQRESIRKAFANKKGD